MNDYMLAGLTKRRAKLSGEAEALRSRLAQIAPDVGYLEAVIRRFYPHFSPASIQPKHPRTQDAAGRSEIPGAYRRNA